MKKPDQWKPRLIATDLGGRVPPNNTEIETAIISAILVPHDNALDVVIDTLKPCHFYSDSYRRIYEAAVAVKSTNEPVDIQTVCSWLKDKGQLEAVGGVAHLARIIDSVPSVDNVLSYVKIIKEKWRLRKAIEICQLASAEGFIESGPVQPWLDSLAARFDAVASEDGKIESNLIFDVINQEIKSYTTKTGLGLPIGFDKLDQLTSGLHAGELVIIAGRPGMAKTALATAIACNVAKKKHLGSMQGVMFFSLEMSKEQIGARMICAEAKIDLRRYRTRTLPDASWDRLVVASTLLSQLPIWIDDTPALALIELRAKIRRQQFAFDKPGQKLGLVVVDYLQLMHEDSNSREESISIITRSLKAIAKEFKIPIIVLSQLNRAVETRSTKDKRPQLSDLRESGAIEQDADVVQFIYRPEYYLSAEQRTTQEGKRCEGLAEIIVAKQRNGPVDTVELQFTSFCTRFDNKSDSAGWR